MAGCNDGLSIGGWNKREFGRILNKYDCCVKSSVHQLQRFAGSLGTAIFKSLVQREVDDLKCPPYECEPL
jgi:hypothetical protein